MKPAVIDPDLDPLLAGLEDGVPDRLTLEARCRLIQRITRSVLDRANRYDFFQYNRDKRPVGFLPGCFDTEDAALAKLVATLAFTPVYIDFFTRNAETLGKAMADKIPAGKLRRQWPEWNAEERLSFLRDLAESQCALFNHDGVRFSSPRIKIHEFSAAIHGAFNRGAWSLSERIMDKEVKINRSHLEEGDALSVAETIWHEQTHSLCQQFAAACNSGKISACNPFARDAEIKRQRLNYDAHVPFVFHRAYNADPEENLARKTEAVFSSAWEENSKFLRRAARFLTALRPPAQD